MSSEVARRLREALDLFETGRQLMRQNLRRAYPEADEQEIDRRLAGWMRTRPGAEFGDSSGRPVDIRDRIG